jgi:CRP-like cAMP-binding protein
MTRTHILEETAPLAAFEAPLDICSVLRPAGTPQTVAAKSVLFRAGDPPQGVFLVLRGSILLSAGNRDSSFNRIASKGSLLGLPSTVSDRPYSLTAEALTEVEVCCIPPDDFRSMLASNPILGMAVVNILSDEVSALRACRSTLAPVHG